MKDYHDTGTKHTHPPAPKDYHDNGIPHTHGPDSLFNHLGNRSLTHKLSIMRTNDSKIISQEDRKKALQAKAEAGQDYHETGYDHTHGPDSDEAKYSENDSLESEDKYPGIDKHLEELLAKIPMKKKKKTGKDYHLTGYPHTHSPESAEKYEAIERLEKLLARKKKEAGEDYHDTGYPHTHSPESEERLEELLAKIPMKEPGEDYHDTGYDHTHGPDSHEDKRKGRRNKHKRRRNTAKKSTPKQKRVRPTWGNAA